MKITNHLHLLTCLMLPLVLAAAMWTYVPRTDFHDGINRRAQLGMPGRFVDIVVSVELARWPEDLAAIFGPATSPAWQDDKQVLLRAFYHDYALIVTYTLLMMLLGLRTCQPRFPGGSARRLLLFFLPLMIGACDALENLGAIKSLNAYPDLSASVVQWKAMASWAKWMLGFVEMAILGQSMLGLRRPTGAARFLRSFAGVILVAAGVLGLWGIPFPSIIPNVFAFGFLAMLPIAVMLFVRDPWWRFHCKLSQLRFC